MGRKKDRQYLGLSIGNNKVIIKVVNKNIKGEYHE